MEHASPTSASRPPWPKKLSIIALEKISVAKVLRRFLADGNFLIVENNPLVALFDVSHVVPALRVAAHMADEADQSVLSFTIVHFRSW